MNNHPTNSGYAKQIVWEQNKVKRHIKNVKYILKVKSLNYINSIWGELFSDISWWPDILQFQRKWLCELFSGQIML